MKITLHQHIKRGERIWVVGRFIDGKRKRSSFGSKDEAENYIADLKSGVTPTPVVSSSPTLGRVITELQAAKLAAGRDRGYVKTIGSILGGFANGRTEARFADVTLRDVEQWLDTNTLASRSTLRAHLSGLFKFGIRRGYRLDNPCSRLEPITYHKPPPKVFTVAEFAKALKWVRNECPALLPWFVLSACCGLRPEEAEKTRRADINFSEGWVRIEKQTTKVRQRRIVYPRKEAMKLLRKSLRGGRLPITSITRRRAIIRLREHLGWRVWPKDITRHTAASYWLCVARSAGEVAENLGNSERVLKRDYKALVTREQARLFWLAVK
jgi:integrase